MEDKEKKTNKQKAAFIAKMILGGCLIPILFAAFIADRIILIILPHVNGETIQETFKNLKNFIPIFYRVGFIVLLYFSIMFFRYVF